MLVQFRVTNFRSIHEEQILSLVASSDATHPENLIKEPVHTAKFRLLKTSAIYGANASGKSNLIKALRCMERFVLSSATQMNDGDEIPNIVPFRLTAQSQRLPSKFEVTLLIAGIRYIYGFSATRERVHEEWLSVLEPYKREYVWFSRQLDVSTGEVKWDVDGPLKDSKSILIERTRDNALALSSGSRENIKPLQQVFRWFRNNLWILDLSNDPEFLKRQTAQKCMDNQSTRDRICRLIQDAGLGINEWSVQEKQMKLAIPPASPYGDERLEKIRSTLVGFVADLQTVGGVELSMPKVATIHKRIDGTGDEIFDLDSDESNGTKRFFALAGPFVDALDTGATLVIDEIDCSMHPSLTRKLIELFQSPYANQKGAQLIFATHDSTLLDLQLLRRDQIWFVEQKRSASIYFSLYDFEDRPRKTTAVQDNYLVGRYGGIPQFGPTFEDLEIK